MKLENKFKYNGRLSSSGDVSFGFPLGAGLCYLLFKWPVLAALHGVLQLI